MSDWDGIPNAITDNATDVHWINLVSVQIVNDSTYIYFRMSYSGSTESNLLWAIATVRNVAGDVFVIMAFVSDSQEDSWVYQGVDLNYPYNYRNGSEVPDAIEHNGGWAKVDETNYTSIEFKVTMDALSSGNASNLASLDMVFWHYDTFSASLSLADAVTEDRAPDTGFYTYNSTKNVERVITSTSTTSTSTTSTSTTSTSTAQLALPVLILPLFILPLLQRKKAY